MTLVQKPRAEGKAVALAASALGNAWGVETYLWILKHEHKHGTREQARVGIESHEITIAKRKGKLWEVRV